jgi:hypothetical protein
LHRLVGRFTNKVAFGHFQIFSFFFTLRDLVEFIIRSIASGHGEGGSPRGHGFQQLETLPHEIHFRLWTVSLLDPIFSFTRANRHRLVHRFLIALSFSFFEFFSLREIIPLYARSL